MKTAKIEQFIAFCPFASDYRMLETINACSWKNSDFETVNYPQDNDSNEVSLAQMSKSGFGVLCVIKLFSSKKYSRLRTLLSEVLYDSNISELSSWKSTPVNLSIPEEEFLSRLCASKAPMPYGDAFGISKGSEIDKNCFFLPIDKFVQLCRETIKNAGDVLSEILPIGMSDNETTAISEHEEREGQREKSYYTGMTIDFSERVIYFGKEDGIENKSKEWRIKESEVKELLGRRIYLSGIDTLWKSFKDHIHTGKNMVFHATDPSKAKSSFNRYWAGLGIYAKNHGFLIKELAYDSQFLEGRTEGRVAVKRKLIKNISRNIYYIPLTCTKTRKP